jgi:general secretion pathway protein D
MLKGPASAKNGETFEITVRLRADGGIRALPMQIAYDPLKLQVLEVREGGYFKREGGSTSFVRQIAPQDGRVLISVQRNGADGLQGDDAVAILEMRPIAVGSARVAVTSANAVSANGSAPNTVLAPPLEIAIQ